MAYELYFNNTVNFKKKEAWSSGQDRGIGRNPSLSRTTKRRITNNQSKNNEQPEAPQN